MLLITCLIIDDLKISLYNVKMKHYISYISFSYFEKYFYDQITNTRIISDYFRKTYIANLEHSQYISSCNKTSISSFPRQKDSFHPSGK